MSNRVKHRSYPAKKMSEMLKTAVRAEHPLTSVLLICFIGWELPRDSRRTERSLVIWLHSHLRVGRTPTLLSVRVKQIYIKFDY